jgi:hypothetical protein
MQVGPQQPTTHPPTWKGIVSAPALNSRVAAAELQGGWGGGGAGVRLIGKERR